MVSCLRRAHYRRCERKRAFPNDRAAARVAGEMSRKRGELFVAYKCFDCGKWHVGHADQSQLLAAGPPPTDRPPKPFCAECGAVISGSRMHEFKTSGWQVEATCSKACSARRQAKRRRERRRLAKMSGGEGMDEIRRPERAMIPGCLLFWFETGTEGGYWAFTQDGMECYEGLHVLADGDWLRIFNVDGSVRWEGRIQLRPYPAFSQSVRKFWIRADQTGVEREFWAEMFFKGLRAELGVAEEKGPQGEQGRRIGFGDA